MLARARTRLRRLPPADRPGLIRGDIRALPVRDGAASLVLAPYGVLQSLTTDADLDAALAEAARVLAPGGTLAIDLVPDLPAWESYRKSFRLRGRLDGASVRLVESVRQDRRKGLTIFDEEFITGTGRRTGRHRFSLTFRTLAMDAFVARIERAGLTIDSVCGDYRGAPWTKDAEAWVVRAKKE
jgi:SAM-dependent methyltransferase